MADNIIFDLHNDLLTAPPSSAIKSLDAQPAFDSDVVYAIWTTRLTSPVEFIKDVQQSGVGLTAIEDLGFLGKESLCSKMGEFAFGDGCSALDVLTALKPVYASLTWNDENVFAGGAHTDIGLTKKGQIMIGFLESAGILLDVAHLSRTAFFMAVEASKRPFICSHTCFDGVYAHRRNVNDFMIKTTILKGGLIGLCLVPGFMGKSRAGIDDVVRQIDYFTQRFGDENLGIGSDFNGCDHPAIKNYSDFKSVEERLLKLGYSQKSIDKIFYLNVKNFLSQRGF